MTDTIRKLNSESQNRHSEYKWWSFSVQNLKLFSEILKRKVSLDVFYLWQCQVPVSVLCRIWGQNGYRKTGSCSALKFDKEPVWNRFSGTLVLPSNSIKNRFGTGFPVLSLPSNSTKNRFGTGFPVLSFCPQIRQRTGLEPVFRYSRSALKPTKNRFGTGFPVPVLPLNSTKNRFGTCFPVLSFCSEIR